MGCSTNGFPTFLRVKRFQVAGESKLSPESTVLPDFIFSWNGAMLPMRNFLIFRGIRQKHIADCPDRVCKSQQMSSGWLASLRQTPARHVVVSLI
jgi:hypothetical protein